MPESIKIIVSIPFIRLTRIRFTGRKDGISCKFGRCLQSWCSILKVLDFDVNNITIKTEQHFKASSVDIKE